MRCQWRNVRAFIRHNSTRHSDQYNAFVSLIDNNQNVASSSRRGALAGISIAIKDTICTKDIKTTCASDMLKDFVSPYDATVVSRLRKAGARITGKTNCDEFGMGSHSIHSVFGPVRNPHRPPQSTKTSSELRSAGGSSGGSAAAVAADLCFAALATDTGGSTRLPAAYCGVAGLKPSYGLISRWGVVSFADSLDCVGILAKQSSDVKTIFDVVNEYDSRDPTSASPGQRQRSKIATAGLLATLRGDKPLYNIKVGIPEEYFPEELDQSSLAPFNRAVHTLRARGADIRKVSLPSTRYALSAYYVIASAEASSNMARYSGVHFGKRSPPPSFVNKKNVSAVYSHTRSQELGREVQKRILLGTYALSADAFDNYFLQAQRVRRIVQEDFQRVIRHESALAPPSELQMNRRGIDFLVYPTAVGTAPSLEGAKSTGELETYLQDVLTVPTSLAGLPTLSVPIGLGKDGWPLGMSVTGQWGFDEAILEFGSVLEKFVFRASSF